MCVALFEYESNFLKLGWLNSIVFVKNEYSGSQFSVTDSNEHRLGKWMSQLSE